MEDNEKECMYAVKWKEDHLAEVDATNDTEAFEKAANYAQGHDTCVDADEYECERVDAPREGERSAQVLRDALTVKRCVTINIKGGAVMIDDRLVHPVGIYSRAYTTLMEEVVLDDLIAQLGYVRREPQYQQNEVTTMGLNGVDTRDMVRTATVVRDVLNMRRIITITVSGATVVMDDHLLHPIESCSMEHKTVMDEGMLDDLIKQLGYVKSDGIAEP